MRVLIFGDSITFGAWDGQGGWADRLKRGYNLEYQGAAAAGNPDPHQIINLGIGGETSQGLLARLENEYLARQSVNWQPVFVIAIGTNDSRRVVATGEQQVSMEDYRNNLRQIIRLARKYSDKILLIGLFPIRDEELPFKDKHYSQAMIRQYDGIIDEVSRELSVPKIEVFHSVIERSDYQSLFFVDGLHPNDAGHQFMHDLVKPGIARLAN